MERIKITPKGWLYYFLQMQMDGLTGNISVAGYPFDSEWWGNPDAEDRNTSDDKCWWPFEQTAYWIDGFVRCAALLDDKAAIKKAEGIIYSVIDNADDDGFIGPHFMKDNHFRWPLVVFFRACMALYEYNGDKKIVDAMSKHFLENKFDYGLRTRELLSVEMLVWLYEQTGNRRFIEIAEDSYVRYNENGDEVYDSLILSRKKMYVHGVTYNEYAKLGALLYKYTGKKEYLKVSEKAITKIDRYYMLPTQCNSSSERLLTNKYWESQETCDICDNSYSLEYILAVTGNPVYADKIEKCVFNAGIGAVTEDFRGLQYFSCANQIITDWQSNHNAYYCGGTQMSYGPKTGTECCTGNINRMMPNYILNMFRADDNAVYADLFGPAAVEIGGIKITEQTNYPFKNSLRFKIESDKAFTFCVRLPKWCVKHTVKGAKGKVDNGYIKFAIGGNAEFEVSFKDEISLVNVYAGAYVMKGPLVYSLGMKGNRVPYRTETADGKEFPSYTMKPDKEFSFAFDENLNPEYHEGNDTLWDIDSDAPYIDVDAHYVRNWKLKPQPRIYHCDWTYNMKWKKETHTFTPRIPANPDIEDKTQRIRLYPLGMSKLRMTVLPLKK